MKHKFTRTSFWIILDLNTAHYENVFFSCIGSRTCSDWTASSGFGQFLQNWLGDHSGLYLPEKIYDEAGKDGAPCVGKEKLGAQDVHQARHSINTAGYNIQPINYSIKTILISVNQIFNKNNTMSLSIIQQNNTISQSNIQ